MTPKSRRRARSIFNEYRAEILEGVASYVEQLEVKEDSSALAVQMRIVRDIRNTK